MRRREFLGVLGGTAVAWPLAVRAQQTERVRRIGMLMASAADDPEFQSRVEAFHQALGGWVDGRNVRIDTRWATTNSDDLRRHAAELAALAPDVLVAGSGTATVAPLRRRPEPCRSCSSLWSTRSAPASSRAWHGRAATRLGSRCSNTE
jgi:putative ABC transport system substrate-binding protein